MIAIGLSKHEALDAVPRAIQQNNYQRSKKTVLDFS